MINTQIMIYSPSGDPQCFSPWTVDSKWNYHYAFLLCINKESLPPTTESSQLKGEKARKLWNHCLPPSTPTPASEIQGSPRGLSHNSFHQIIQGLLTESQGLLWRPLFLLELHSVQIFHIYLHILVWSQIIQCVPFRFIKHYPTWTKYWARSTN